MIFNLATATDSYKVSHWKQYPPGTERVFLYLEARRPWVPEVVFFGLQYLIKRYLERDVRVHDVERAATLWAKHFGSVEIFNLEGWYHLAIDHEGQLPVSIRAVPEGSVTAPRTPLLTIENTCPRCYWVPGWLETLLVQLWYPITVASNSRECKKLIAGALARTGDPSLLPFKLHDFGFRGVSSQEQAAIGGAAHLVSFQGTDTFPACEMLSELYGEPMAGGSIPAAEHSTITSWGDTGELAAFRNMLDQFPRGLVACVSDSYDIMHAVKRLWGGELRDRVLARDGTLVVRPDSGPVVETVLAVLAGLREHFGVSTNDKGFAVLPPQVRVIQGDGIDRAMIADVLDAMEQRGWSADNIAFGSGGALLQRFDRDTLSVALKCSHVAGAYGERDVYKAPIGDPSKASLRGRVTHELLREVYRDGMLLINEPLSKIRERAEL